MSYGTKSRHIDLGPKKHNDNIKIDLNEEFDINEFHQMMKDKLSDETRNTADIISILIKDPTKIENYNKEIKDREDGIKLKRYMNEAEEYIDKYNRYSYSKKEIDMANLYLNNRRYLEMCGQYIKIEIITRRTINDKLCHSCGKSLSTGNKDMGVIVCKCGSQREYIQPQAFKEKMGESHVKSNKIDSSNIMKEFDLYSCIEIPSELPSNWEEELDKYFRSRKMKIGSEYKNLPKKGRYTGKSNRSMLNDALKNRGMNKCYKHVNYIGHYYFGWDIPDTKAYRVKFQDIYIKTETIFYQMDHKERSSSIPNQYRVFKILEMLGFPCSRDEFKMPSEDEDLEKIEFLWRKMCEGCKDEEIRFIKTKRF